MVSKKVIRRTLLLFLLFLAISTYTQAAELKEVKASDILEKIEKGDDIYLEDVIIKGEFNLDKIKLRTDYINHSKGFTYLMGPMDEQKIIGSYIQMENSVFENNVSFYNVQFAKGLFLENVSFLGDADFTGASFIGDQFFINTTFSGNTSFTGAVFKGWLTFYGSFKNPVYFDFAVFDNSAVFSSK